MLLAGHGNELMYNALVEFAARAAATQLCDSLWCSRGGDGDARTAAEVVHAPLAARVNLMARNSWRRARAPFPCTVLRVHARERMRVRVRTCTFRPPPTQLN